MPSINTRGDSMHIYLTGATLDGAGQYDPDASLGKYRSLQQAVAVKPSSSTITLQPSGQVLNTTYAAAANGTGTGTLAAVGDDEVAWTPPGGTQGAPVTLTALDGQYELVEAGGGEYDKWIRINRPTSLTANLSGSASVELVEETSVNVFGLDDVSDAERTAGDTNYRCCCAKNDAATTVKSVKVLVDLLGTSQLSDVTQLPASGAGTLQTTGSLADWPADGFVKLVDSGGVEREIVYYSSRTSTQLTVPSYGRGLALGDENAASAGAATDTMYPVSGISLGLEAPSSQPAGSFTDNTTAGETVAPAGVSFATPVVDADALSIGDLAPGYIYGIWIKRVVPAGAEPNPAVPVKFTVKNDAA